MSVFNSMKRGFGWTVGSIDYSSVSSTNGRDQMKLECQYGDYVELDLEKNLVRLRVGNNNAVPQDCDNTYLSRTQAIKLANALLSVLKLPEVVPPTWRLATSEDLSNISNFRWLFGSGSDIPPPDCREGLHPDLLLGKLKMSDGGEWVRDFKEVTATTYKYAFVREFKE